MKMKDDAKWPIILETARRHCNDAERHFPFPSLPELLPVTEPYWTSKPLAEMSDEEWESLCDGCAKCCLNKIEDEDTGELFFTNAACQMLDLASCRCTDYRHRCTRVPTCLDLRADFTRFDWLPSTCAYRRLHEGLELPSWHPLLTGDRESVHRAGESVRDFAICENDVEDLTDHVIEWLS